MARLGEKTKIAFLTGQSNPNYIGLSPLQFKFMKSIPLDESLKLYKNFPYTEGKLDYKDTNIFSASYYNSKQYLLSRIKCYSTYYKSLFLQEFDQIDNIVLLSGSCGLELFSNLYLEKAILNKIHIFGYGPVSRKIPNCQNIFLVQGESDWISKFWKLNIHKKIQSDHLDYLSKQEVLDLLIEFLDKIEIK